MKPLLHKPNQICFVKNIPVVITRRYYDNVVNKHKYNVKHLDKYFENHLSNTFTFRSFEYEDLSSTAYFLKDVMDFAAKIPNLTKLYFEYPEHSL